MAAAQHVIGIDFGTLSGRAVVVRASDGEVLGAAEHEYRHGVMDRELAGTGERLPPDWALQDPQDYIEVLRHAVPEALEDAGVDPGSIVGVGTDFTSCTIMPTTKDGTPLCQLDGFRERPHAYAKLWKHHAAQPQADRVTEVAAERKEPWLSRYGGRISSEWAVPKVLQLLEEEPELYERADRFIEAVDWIVWQLCGEEVRSACPAGYKAMFQDGRYPANDYFAALDPRLENLVEEKLRFLAGRTGKPRGLADRRGGGVDRPSTRDRGGGRQHRRARDRAGGGRDRAGPHGAHHGHIGLPRAGCRRSRRNTRDVRGSQRRSGGRTLGL